MKFILAKHNGDHAWTGFYAGGNRWTKERIKAVTFELSSSAHDMVRELEDKTKGKIAVIAR